MVSTDFPLFVHLKTLSKNTLPGADPGFFLGGGAPLTD